MIVIFSLLNLINWISISPNDYYDYFNRLENYYSMNVLNNRSMNLAGFPFLVVATIAPAVVLITHKST